MIDPALLKTLCEVVGVLLTTSSIILMGRGGRAHRIGLWISLVAAGPWIVFAALTTSWTLIAQSLVLIVANLINLLKPRPERHAA